MNQLALPLAHCSVLYLLVLPSNQDQLEDLLEELQQLLFVVAYRPS
jgi:hypothetical protein